MTSQDGPSLEDITTARLHLHDKQAKIFAGATKPAGDKPAGEGAVSNELEQAQHVADTIKNQMAKLVGVNVKPSKPLPGHKSPTHAAHGTGAARDPTSTFRALSPMEPPGATQDTSDAIAHIGFNTARIPSGTLLCPKGGADASASPDSFSSLPQHVAQGHPSPALINSQSSGDNALEASMTGAVGMEGGHVGTNAPVSGHTSGHGKAPIKIDHPIVTPSVSSHEYHDFTRQDAMTDSMTGLAAAVVDVVDASPPSGTGPSETAPSHHQRQNPLSGSNDVGPISPDLLMPHPMMAAMTAVDMDSPGEYHRQDANSDSFTALAAQHAPEFSRMQEEARQASKKVQEPSPGLWQDPAAATAAAAGSDPSSAQFKSGLSGAAPSTPDLGSGPSGPAPSAPDLAHQNAVTGSTGHAPAPAHAASPQQPEQATGAGPQQEHKTGIVAAVIDRIKAPFVASAGGLDRDATRAAEIPDQVEATAFLTRPASIESGDTSKGFSHAAQQMNQERAFSHLPDTLSRVGEAVGGVVQHVVHSVDDAVQNATAPYDMSKPYGDRPVHHDGQDQPHVPPGTILDPGAEMSSLRREQLAGMAATGSPARKRETLVDKLVYPFSKDSDDPSNAITAAKSYYDYMEEKARDAGVSVDHPDLHPGNMPNAPTANVERATHSHLEHAPAQSGPRAALDTPDAAVHTGELGTAGVADAAKISGTGVEPRAGGAAGAAAAPGTLGAAGAGGITGPARAVHQSRDAATPKDDKGDLETARGGKALTADVEGRVAGTAEKVEDKGTGFLSSLKASVGSLFHDTRTDASSVANAPTGPGDLPADLPAAGGGNARDAPIQDVARTQDTSASAHVTSHAPEEKPVGILEGLVSKVESLFNDARPEPHSSTATYKTSAMPADPTATAGDETPLNDARTYGQDMGGYGRGTDFGSTADASEDIPVMPYTSTEEMLRAGQVSRD